MKKILSIFAIALLSISISSVVKAEELDFGGSDMGSESLSFGGSDLQDQGSSDEEIVFGGSDLDGDSSSDNNGGEDSSNNNGGGSTTSGGGGSTSHSGSIVNVSGGFSSVPTNPTVLGASTGPEGETLMCAPYITTFMRMGKANDVEEVKKLQRFLNEFNDAKLPVTGFFGPLTDKAVKDLQTKYANEILKPWDEAGLSSNLQATGFVYRTTVWFINSHKCPEAQTPFPVLN